MIFVDTNYFLRFLIRDIDDQHDTAKDLFKRGAEGKIQLCTSVIVVFEIYWVLASVYENRKEELVDALRSVMKMTFIEFEQEELLRQAIELFKESTIEFEDAYNLSYAHTQEVDGFMTFDKKLQREYARERK